MAFKLNILSSILSHSLKSNTEHSTKDKLTLFFLFACMFYISANRKFIYKYNILKFLSLFLFQIINFYLQIPLFYTWYRCFPVVKFFHLKYSSSFINLIFIFSGRVLRYLTTFSVPNYTFFPIRGQAMPSC